MGEPEGRDAVRAAAGWSGRAAHPLLAAVVALALVSVAYGAIPGDDFVADAVRAALAAVGACLAWALAGERPVRGAVPGREGCGAGRGQLRLGESPVRLATLLALTLASAALAVLAPLALTGPSELAALGAAAGDGSAAGTPSVPACVAVLILSCVGTATWEETLFRWLGPRALSRGLSSARDPFLASTVLCAALFALFHALPLLSDAVEDRGALLCALRFCQAFLFAVVLAAVVGRTGRGMVRAIGLHACYDLVCFLPVLAIAPQAPLASTDALLALVQSPSGLVASLVPLSVAGVLAARDLSREGELLARSVARARADGCGCGHDHEHEHACGCGDACEGGCGNNHEHEHGHDDACCDGCGRGAGGRR